MNVTCTGCPAKYAVPDEKVRGKKVRITCKHCGTNIIVDGTVSDPAQEASPKPAAQPTASAAKSTAVEPKQPAAAKAAAAPSEVMFIVGFADDRQEMHTIARIVELYSAGKIDDDTLVWKDGMPDWLSPFDVPELAAAFRAKNVAPRAQAPTAPAFMPADEEDATLVVKSPLDDPEVAAAIAASAPSAPPTTTAAAPTTTAAAPATTAAAPAPAAAKTEEEPMFGKPAAARRVEKRGGAVDLFGKVAEAGSEGDVSLDLGSSEDRAQKLTGARNESSVLFSLDALTKPDPKASTAKAKEREREASEALFGESAPNPLLNLGSGGLNAMAAPDFTKPVVPGAKVVPLGDASEETSPPSKGRGGVILLVAFLALAAAAAVAFVMMKKQQIVAEPAPATPSATSQTTASAEPVASEAPAASVAPSASAAPTASAEADGSSTAPEASNSAGALPASASAPGSKPAAAAPPAAAAAATPAAAAAAKPADPAATTKPAEAPAATEGAAFDKNAAIAALSAAAGSAGSCKTADGPTGSGKVSVTFAPSGRATATSVAGDLAGTEVGGCVARLFRAAKVPPFSGDPVTVSKSFTIQ